MSRLPKESAFGSVASTSQEDLEEETPTSASNRTLNVTLLSSEWKSTKGGLSTISRELAIQLAKHLDVEVSVYLPQCSEEDKKIAASLNVKIIEAEELPGLEPVLWLGSVPKNHAMDCVIGHGVHLGRQIPLIKRQNPHCKWVQVVHTAPEDLGMYKSYEEAISKGEQKHQGEVKLCELADQVVAVGPKLADAFARYLRPSKKDQDVLTLTPSIFNEFLGVEQATEERRTFCVLVFGRGDSEDFKLKGYDIAVQAVAELKDTSYQLMFVGAPAGKEDEVAERLLQHGIPPCQLTVRRFKESRDQLANLFCEVDLAIMPSRTEGFGLTALEALSAGLPVLVSGNSGLGIALKEVVYGSQCVVDSEDPKEWAKKIKAVREKSREVRLRESKVLCNKYLEKYRWQESCGVLLEKMQNLVFGSSKRKNEKDKRPLSAFDNHPSKRPRGEVTHHEGSSGYGKPVSSVDYNQLPLTPVTQSQLYQTGHVQTSQVESFCGHDMSSLSVGSSQLPFTRVTQSYQSSPSGYGRPPVTMQYNHISYPGTTTQACGDATYQRMHTQSSSSYDRPPLSVEYNLLPVAPVTQSSTLTYLTSHPQSVPMRLHSSVEYNPLVSALASQSYGGYHNNGSHTQSFSCHDMSSSSVGPNQLPFTGVTQTYQSSPSGYSRPPLTMENKHISYPGTSTQAHGEASYHRMHTETQSTLTRNEQIYQGRFTHFEGSFGHYRPSPSVTCSRSPFVTATPAIDETSIWKNHTQPSSSDYDRPSSSVQHNQLPAAPVTQYSTLTYQTSHPQCFPGQLLPSSLEYNQFPSTVASLSYQGYNNSRGHIHSFSGHDMPPSSVGHTQVPLSGTPQSYQPSRALSLVVKVLKDEYKRRSQLKPLLWQNTLKLPLEDVYTRLKIVSRRTRDFQLQNDEVSMYGIFEDKEDVLVLVEGNPGIGKTTFCLKIAYDWAKEQIPKGYSFPEFVVVLLLKCRDINGDIVNAIAEQLLPECMEETDKKEFMDFIKDFHYQEKVLIILDGLDELPKKSESHVDRLLSKKFLPFCYVLVTSRQERGIAVRQKVDFDILLQIQGFTEEDAFEYIRKHFRYAGPEHLATGERLITQIKENTFLQALPSNPLNLLLLCVVFEDYQGELPSFRTELYQIIIRCLLRRYCAKHNLEAPGDDQALEEKYKDSLLVLGELAWRCLLEGRFSFREEELAKFESEIKDLAARKLGLVFKEASVKRLNPQHEYHFFHKTFQEFLAATYLAHKLLKEGVDVFREFKLWFGGHVADEYRQVFLFVSGILGKDAGVLFKQIGETLVSEGWDWLKCSEEEATFFTESFSESQKAEQMAVTLCSFIPFPLMVEITVPDENFEETANILMVAEACRNFSQLQHPVHLTIEIKDSDNSLDCEMVAQFLVSCPKLQTFSLRLFGLEHSVTAFFKGLSGNSSISSFTFRDAFGMYWDVAVAFGNSLAANKTLTTVTLELINECNDDWASALERGLSADTPFTSVVLKIYGSLSAEAIGALKTVLSNRSLTSLTLIIYGEMQDSLATSVGEALTAESILKSLTLIVYGKLSYSGAVSLGRGFLENSALSSLEVKVFGELPDNWVTVAEKVREAKKTKMSVVFYPNITGTISKAQVTRLNPGFELQSLTLNLWGELSCSGADTLCNVLITLSMCCVTLNIHGKVTDNVAECIVSYLKPCKTLSSLSINIWGELTRGGNSALQELACNGKYSVALNVCSMASDSWIGKDHNTSLTTLSLAINNSSDLSGDWICGLSDGLAKNTSLTTLSRTINNCTDLKEDWARVLGDGLAKNSSSTTLNLTIDDCIDLSGDWALGVGDGLAKNTSLTTLSLTINDWVELSEDWGRGVGDGLAKNTSLTTLSLTINNCGNLSGDWGRGVGDGLAKNTSLTTLSLTINNCRDLSGHWARGLGDGLAKNTSLTTLSLTSNYYSYLFGNWARGLGDGLARNTSLTTLSLTVDSCIDLSENWADGLGHGWAINTSLTTLSLTMNYYSYMFKDWGYDLAKNTSLTTLSLTINNFSEILYGDWARDLGDVLAKNSSLTTLSLTINDYTGLSEDWVCYLGLGRSKSLTVVNVTLTTCIKMSEAWLCGLYDSLTESDTITALNFTFNDLSGTTEGLELDLGKHFAGCKLSPVNLTVSLYGEGVVS